MIQFQSLWWTCLVLAHQVYIVTECVTSRPKLLEHTLFCSFVSSGNYLCHYGGADTFNNKRWAFSAQCFNQNKNRLSRREEESRTYPYFNSSVGAPPGALRILLFAYVYYIHCIFLTLRCLQCSLNLHATGIRSLLQHAC